MLVVQAQGFLDLRVPSVQVPQNQTLQVTVELETTPNYMEHVQVTATKTPLSIGDVAALTDIVDRSTIDSRGDQTLTQAISRLPGVFISTQLGIFETVTLRGMPKVGNEFTNTLVASSLRANYHQEEGRVTANYMRAFTPNVRFVGTFGYRDVQLKFIEDGDFIGSPYDLESNTLTMYPFSQQQDEAVYYSEDRLELTLPSGSVTHSVLVGGSYERNNGTLASDFIFDDPDLFGFSINYLNPVIPPRNDWQHFETSGRIYHLGITGLFAQYMIEPTPRLLLLAAGRYDRLDLDVTRGSDPKVEDTFDAFSPKTSATFKVLSTPIR